MKRGRTDPMICGDEWDAFSKWRKVLAVFYNTTGLSKWTKRKYNKRVRKAAQKDLREW